MKLKQIYNEFLHKGELKEILPDSTGIWEEDAAKFKEAYGEITEAFLDLPDDVLEIEDED